MKRDPTINDIPFFQNKRNVHCHFVGEPPIEDKHSTNLLRAYCKHVGSRSTDAFGEPMKRDPTINDILFFQRKRNVHCHSFGASPIKDKHLTNPVIRLLHACRGSLNGRPSRADEEGSDDQ